MKPAMKLANGSTPEARPPRPSDGDPRVDYRPPTGEMRGTHAATFCRDACASPRQRPRVRAASQEGAGHRCGRSPAAAAMARQRRLRYERRGPGEEVHPTGQRRRRARPHESLRRLAVCDHVLRKHLHLTRSRGEDSHKLGGVETSDRTESCCALCTPATCVACDARCVLSFPPDMHTKASSRRRGFRVAPRGRRHPPGASSMTACASGTDTTPSSTSIC